MTVWIVQQEMTAEEEVTLRERPYITLPWPDLPDLTHIHSRGALRALLQVDAPDAPPEALETRLSAIWPILIGLQKEDIVAVPLRASQLVMVGEITGGYAYLPQQEAHSYPVRWLEQTVPMQRFRRQASVFEEGYEPIVEVQDAKLRGLIRDSVPLGYNRFRKWKWLLGIGLAMQLLHLLQQTMR